MKLVEIFQSIEGEVSGHGQGRLTTFIRFAGCNLSCNYCDTPHSQKITDAINMSIEEIISHPLVSESPNITITGGEPLLQLEELELLLEYFSTVNKKVTIETNGSINPKFSPSIFENVSWVVDYKPHHLMEFPYSKLTEKDFIKFVIQNKKDFMNAVQCSLNWFRWSKAKIAFSLILNEEIPSVQTLIDWLIAEKLYFVLVNVQIHKLCNLK